MDGIALFALISIFFPVNYPTSKGKAKMEVGEGSNMNPASNEEAMMEAGEGSNLNPMSNEEARLEEMNDGGNLPAQDDQPSRAEVMLLANIETIMKRILPQGTIIEGDGTKEMMRGCMSEFVQYIIREAEKETQNAGRRLIRNGDILSAMQKVGFSNYIDPATAYLEGYRKQFPKRNKGRNAGSSSNNPPAVER